MKSSTIKNLNKNCIVFFICFICFTSSLRAQAISNEKVLETTICLNILVQPIALPQIICIGGIVNLSVIVSGKGITYQWYRNTIPSTIGGELIDGANTSSYLPETTNAGVFYYYVVVTNSCLQATSNVSGSVSIGESPIIESTTDGNICGSGVVTLKATSSAGTINWFSAASGGTTLATGTTYSPNVSTTTIFYVDATNNGCTSSTRTAVTATVKTIPTITNTTDGFVCGSGVVSLMATSSAGTINWYSAASGGTTLATGPTYSPHVSATTIYYVDATDNGCTTTTRSAVTANVVSIPTITNTTDGNVCGSGVVSLNAVSSAGTINWYTTANGGTTLATGTTYSPNVSATTIYYADATDNGCTSSTRTAVNATVKTIPTITNTTDGNVCGSGVVSLNAVSSAGTLNWYSVTNGGTTLATGTAYSPNVSATTVYYVDATDNYCTTSTRTSVTATVKTIPTITNITDGNVCGSGIISLKAVSSAGTINWYSVTSGGTILATGTTYSPNVSATTVYYVDATNNGCTSPVRTAVSATVISIPTITNITDGSLCGGGVVSLKSVSSAGTINWYSAANGGTTLATGTAYSPNVSATTIYYVDATDNGCKTSTRTAVTATVKTIPTITNTTDGNICGNGTVTLKATSTAGIINWYSSTSGGTILATGTTYSPNVSATTVYYVDATNNGCTTGIRKSLIAKVDPYPSNAGIISGPATVCPSITGLVFSVPVIPNAISYDWTIPSDWNITSGIGTNKITVTSGSTGNSTISVSGVNDCGNGVSKSISIVVGSGEPSTPGAISGTSLQCPAISTTYSVASVPNATSYDWSVPSGWTITSGAGSNVIIVNTGNTGKNGTISVSAINSCGTSGQSDLNVSVQAGTPVKPGNISGPSALCPSVAGVNYSIYPVSNATSYTWTVPVGWIITSANNGTSIIVTSGTSGKNGNISVSAANSCGTSLQSTLAVTVNAGVPVPGEITGNTTCAMSSATFSIAALSNADSYNWTVPAGWKIISGATTNSVILTTGAFGQNGNIAISATNVCGTSAMKTLAVTLKNTPFATASPLSQNLCTGNLITTLNLSTSNGVSGTTYTWSRSNSGSAGVGTLVQSGTSNTISGTATNTTSTTQTTDYTIIATANGCSTTTTASVNVYAGISNNDLSSPTQQYNCNKDVQVIIKQSATPLSGGNGIYIYTWEINGNGNKWDVIPGETGSNLNILQTNRNVFYRRTVSSGNCFITISNEVHVNLSAITVEDPANVTGGGNYCSGGSGVPVGIDASTSGAYYQLYLGSVKIGAPLSGTGFPLSFGLITTAGIYTVTGYTINPNNSVCSRSMQGSAQVVIDAKPTTSNAGSNQSICNVTTATLAGNSPSVGAGKWTLESGTATISSPLSRTSGVTNLTEGSNTFLWTITNGACTSESQVTIQIDKPATAPVAGVSQNLCNAAITTLSANTPLKGSGIWTRQSGSGTITNVSDPKSGVTGLLPGDNIFLWTITNPGVCPQPGSSAVTIHIDAPATISIAGSNQNICISTPTATLSANMPTKGTGLWSVISGSGTVSTPSNPSSAVTALGIGSNVFRWTITNGACSSSSDVTVSADAKPDASNAGISKNYCDNITTTVLAANNPSTGTGIWTRVNGTGIISDINKYNSTVTGLTPGSNVFKWTISNGVCSSVSSNVTISINTPPSIQLQPATETYICEGAGSASISATAAGSGITYLWQVSINSGLSYSYISGSAYSGYNTSNLIINNPTAAMNGYLYRLVVSAQSGCASFVNSTASKLVNKSVWQGTTNTDWNTASNWSDKQVPGTSCPIVTIPVVPTNFYPVLSSGPNATIINLVVNPNASITISGNTMQLAGTIINKGTFDASNGSIELNGSIPQIITPATFKNNALSNLIISNTNSAGVTLNGDIDIYRSVTFGISTGKLNTGGYLTLKSTVLETAWIGDLTGHTVTGNVTVERFLNSAVNGKKWIFLCSPVKGQTIRESWMEGGVITTTPTGLGIQITGPGGTAAGFDLQSATPSMKTWNEVNGTWAGIPTTNIQLNNTKGYMVFVRGDRSITDPFAKSNTTTIRSKGDLIIGEVIIPIQSPVDKFISVANPYASAIDMSKLAKNSNIDFFTIWNPKLGGQYGYGGYETYYLSNNSFRSFPWNKEYKYIQSGEAFFVQTSNIPGAVIKFSESVKANGSESTHFRPQGIPGKMAHLQTIIESVNTSGIKTVIDGTIHEFDENFNNDLDDLDGRKVMNSGENLTIKKEGKDLFVERRKQLTEKDTIQFNLSGLKVQNYILELNAQSLSPDQLQAFVEDSYLKTKTLLNSDGQTEVPFSVTNVAGSSAAKRFRIVFGRVMAPLPVTFTSVKAVEKNGNIIVEWKVENEINLKQYEVEKSADGNQFSKVSTIPATNGVENNYSWTDKNAFEGNNFYRIKSVDQNGKIYYTEIVKVKITIAAGNISIFPNPVTNGNINLQLINQTAGNYGVRLLNPLGQVILTKVISHSGGNTTAPVPWNYNQAKGIYQLEVTRPGGEVKVIKVMY